MHCVHFVRVYKDPYAMPGGSWICVNCGTKGEGPHDTPVTYEAVEAVFQSNTGEGAADGRG